MIVNILRVLRVGGSQTGRLGIQVKLTALNSSFIGQHTRNSDKELK